MVFGLNFILFIAVSGNIRFIIVIITFLTKLGKVTIMQNSLLGNLTLLAFAKLILSLQWIFILI